MRSYSRIITLATNVLYSHQEDTMAVHFNHEAPVGRETFVRGHEVIVIECLGAELVVEFAGAPAESFRFEDPVELVFLKTDLERELVRDGWTLMRYESVRPSARSSSGSAFGPVGRAH
jgi:hypothetical protein